MTNTWINLEKLEYFQLFELGKKFQLFQVLESFQDFRDFQEKLVGLRSKKRPKMKKEADKEKDEQPEMKKDQDIAIEDTHTEIKSVKIDGKDDLSSKLKLKEQAFQSQSRITSSKTFEFPSGSATK